VKYGDLGAGVAKASGNARDIWRWTPGTQY
jgi:hypothetical protein